MQREIDMLKAKQKELEDQAKENEHVVMPAFGLEVDDLEGDYSPSKVTSS